MWLYQHIIRQNLEFAADAYAIANSTDVKEYQYLMLRQAIGYSPTAVTHQFFNSSIKNRIRMLQQQSSKKRQQLKVLFILPALGLFLMAFNVKTKTVFTYKNAPQAVVHDSVKDIKIDNITITIDKNSTDEVLQNDVEFLAERGIVLKYKGLKRNFKEEITALKVTYDNGSGSKGVYQQIKNGSTITPFKISISFNNGETANIEILQEDSNSTPEANPKAITAPIITDKNSKLIEIITTNDEEKILVDGEEISRDSLSKIGRLEEQLVKTMNITESIDQDTEINEVKVEETNGNYKKITYLKQHSTPNNKRFLVTESNLSKEEKPAKEIDTHISTPENTSSPSKEEDPSQQKEEPLYIIDGKEATKKQIEKLSPDSIKSVNVLKDDKAIKKYGEKGKNGVIEITTRK